MTAHNPTTQTALSVNLNKVALLRNARHLTIPDIERAARVCLAAGAAGLTVHPRPDERHIRAADVPLIAGVLQAAGAGEFNMEGNPFDANGRFLELVQATGPAQCTLVPDSPDQATSDHGFDIAADGDRLRPVIADLKSRGIRVSVFMDADNLDGIRALARLGADRIELYTEPYAAAFLSGDAQRLESSLAEFRTASQTAQAAGMAVNAGHDLNLENLPPFLAAVPNVLEVSIGHALIAEAIFRGLDQTVRDYNAAIAGVTPTASSGTVES